MIQFTNDFSKAEIGQKVWSIQLGDCTIDRITAQNVLCINKNGRSDIYLLDGKRSANDCSPSLFWRDPLITIPAKPERSLTRWLNIYADSVNPNIGHPLFDSKEEADLNAKPGRIDCVRLVYKPIL